MLNNITTTGKYLSKVFMLLPICMLSSSIYAETRDVDAAEIIKAEMQKAQLEKAELESTELNIEKPDKSELENEQRRVAELKVLQQKRERIALYKLVEKHIAFTKELNVFVESDNRLRYITEGDESSLQAVYARLEIRRNEGIQFNRRNNRVLRILRALPAYNPTEDYSSFERGWWNYQQRLESTIERYQQTLGTPSQSTINKNITSIHKLDALGTTVADLQIGALLTQRPDLRNMAKTALSKFLAIPSPIVAQEAMRQSKMKSAVFPKAIYSDADLELLFKEAFEATGWNEKVIKVHLKEKEWKPSFNHANLYLGDTMAAWIGAQDENGDGKMYDFRMLVHGEQAEAVRYSHEMTGWILVENIK